MFCTNCGNQLPDGTRFCVHCGTVQDSISAAAPAPVAQPPVQTSLAEDSFLNAVAVEEATYETPYIATPDYTPPVRSAAPKKNKTGLIIAIIVVLVLVLAVGGVFFLLDYMDSKAYAEATAMMEAGDINGALTAFEDLGDYEDSAKMVKNLKKYQQAMTKLDAHQYDEALEIFKDLGKFHDSKTYVESGVEYHKAKYLMACGKKADPAGLSLLVLGDAIAEKNDSMTTSNELFFAAAEIFDALGDYKDSADLASECRYEMGLLEVQWNNLDRALELMEMLNEEDAANLQAAIDSNSAEASLPQDLQDALDIWLDKGNKYNIETEIRNAYDKLKPYKDRYFQDPEMEKLYQEVMDALKAQLDAVKSGDDVKDWEALYKARADLYAVCDKLYEEFGFLKGTDLKDDFIGIYETAAKYPVIEASLKKQLFNVTAPWDDANNHYYAPYTNDTGCDFTLTIAIEFYQSKTKAETGKEMTILVKAGETVRIPLIPTVRDISEYNGWKAVWSFTLS